MIDLAVPEPNSKEILIKILTCGVCHTELDEIEGRLHPKLPIVPGHEIVGKVERLGSKVTKFRKGDRVGIAWTNLSCGECSLCREEKEEGL